MPVSFRRFTKKLFVGANIVFAVLLLLTALIPYLDPGKWWFISILSLGLSFIAIIVLLFLIFWLFVKARLALISLIALLLSWKSITQLFALNTSNTFSYAKKKNTVRVVTWNVARFIELKQNNNHGSQQRLEMMQLLKKQNADVLCLQEFFTSINPEYYNNIAFIQKELGYKWFCFSYEPDGYNHWYSSIIFSRLPIVDTGKVYYPRPARKEALLHADVKFNNDTIRIYTTHLQSVLFEKSDYDKIESIQHGDDGMIDNSKSIFSKLKNASGIRGSQADAVKEQLQQTSYPVIFTGDLNDVPGSYAYNTIRGDMQDAFLEKGFGIGRTFSSLSPTLRIDYIFADRKFSIDQLNKYVRNLSDHYMIVADLSLKKSN